MRILLLGGGQQGRAVLYDLAQSPEVEAVTCVDINATSVKKYVDQLGAGKIQVVSLDAEDTETLGKLMGTGYDVIIDMLPRQYARAVGEAAVEHGIHLVNTNYDHDLRDLAASAERAGVTVLPEMGMDPGIDLVLGGEAVRRFDTVTKLMSYGGGFPEAAAVDNPLKYKITWTWEGVLNSYVRDARIIENGELVEIPHTDIFNLSKPPRGHEIEIEELGKLEAFCNGDAAVYAEKFGIADTVKTSGRYALRWPGHGTIWQLFKQLGFLDETPVAGLPGGITPRQFMVKHLEPKLQFKDNERDVNIIRIEAEGTKDGKVKSLVMQLLDYRNLSTGLTAMSRTVGFAASIAAQMIVKGQIKKSGLLSPVRDVPYEPFMEELKNRGLEVQELVS